MPSYVSRLQAIRGIAAIVVAFFHGWGVFAPTPNWARFYRGATNIFYGPGAVFTFLILSGFVLGLSLARHQDYSLAKISSFLTHRFWRLWPAFLGLGLIYELYGAFSDSLLGRYLPPNYVIHSVSLREWCLNLLLLRTSLNPVTWSLRVEWLFSIIIPFTFIWTHRKPTRNFVVLAVSLGVYYFLNANVFHLGSEEMPWCFVFMCYAGVVLADYRRFLTATLGRMSSPLRLAVVLAAFSVCATTLHFGNHLELFTLAMTIVIGAVVSGHFPRLFYFLDSPLLVHLGNISYSFYLLNPLVLCAVGTLLCWLVGRRTLENHFVVSDLSIAILSILLTFPVATLSFQIFEHPFLKRGSK